MSSRRGPEWAIGAVNVGNRSGDCYDRPMRWSRTRLFDKTWALDSLAGSGPGHSLGTLGARPATLWGAVLLASSFVLQACGSGAGAAKGRVAAPSVEAQGPQKTGQDWLQAWAGQGRGPFLWRVERDGAVSHVFGTVHVGVRLFELPQVVGERLDASHSLIVEADTEDMSSPRVLAGLMLPAHKSLRSMIGDKYWRVLRQYLDGVIPAQALDRMPPWMVQTMLTVEDPLSGENRVSLDTQLVERARKNGKRLLYLETAEMQLALLASLIGVDELRETLDDVPGARRGLKVLLRAYRTGNLPALAGLTLNPAEMAKSPDHFEALLFKRNREWMDMLQRELPKGGVFVAVGAAHFVGDDGLLELLRRAGFTITRVAHTGQRSDQLMIR